eukprot:TRINITY_DN2519_c0_g1_i1.p1 TRINITY_DN2519_c0_g1~~TRINITY_DN2519_c0_g1_i1.p1  ORF type:complete len:311 (+),score=45.96 TRINITY_DN2519_c0_g1_i1:79-1011(+)
MSSLADIPSEIVAIVLTYLDGVSLIKFSSTCKDYLSLTKADSNLFKACYLTEQPYQDCIFNDRSGITRYTEAPPPSTTAWREAYIGAKKKSHNVNKVFKEKHSTVAQVLAKSSYVPDTSFFGKITAGLFSRGKNPVRVLFIGLDAAGKTTTLYKLKLVVETHIPTIGFMIEEGVMKSNVKLTLWDVGGPDKIRPLWRHYYGQAAALIFMIDSNDRERLPDARHELYAILSDESFPSPFVLLFANKQDLPNAMSVTQIVDTLMCSRWPKSIVWFIQPCCAITGDGIIEGFDWLANQLDNATKKKVGVICSL